MQTAEGAKEPFRKVPENSQSTDRVYIPGSQVRSSEPRQRRQRFLNLGTKPAKHIAEPHLDDSVSDELTQLFTENELTLSEGDQEYSSTDALSDLEQPS